MFDIDFLEDDEVNNYDTLNRYDEVIHRDNIVIKQTYDFRFKRDEELESSALKNDVVCLVFKRKPRKKYYYYDALIKKQFFLKNKKYLVVGSNNRIEVVNNLEYRRDRNVFIIRIKNKGNRNG
jgi:NH3-dependent NAD+ synthetase